MSYTIITPCEEKRSKEYVTSHEYSQLEPGAIRRQKKFLFLPKKIAGHWWWMETIFYQEVLISKNIEDHPAKHVFVWRFKQWLVS